jgi:hypothetical protein
MTCTLPIAVPIEVALSIAQPETVIVPVVGIVAPGVKESMKTLGDVAPYNAGAIRAGTRN